MNRTIEINKDIKAMIHLGLVDDRLGIIISYFGKLRLCLRTDFFLSLAKSIVGQQLSVKSANTIWNRLKDLSENICPELILSLNEDILRGIGISRPKINYLKNLSQAIIDKRIDLNSIYFFTDDEVINILTSVKGIGTWTAEMFLIFSLGRLDVFSNGDVGLKRSIAWLYNKGEAVNLDMVARISDNWRPYRSIASLYLWEIINSGLINKYKDFEEFRSTI